MSWRPARLLRFAPLALVLLGGCEWQRTELAGEARGEMRNLSRDQVLACMGQPLSRRMEGDVELFRYNSAARASGAETVLQAADARVLGQPADPPCTVEIGVQNGWVSRVRYTGPQGQPLSRTGQCAVAVQNCIPN